MLKWQQQTLHEHSLAYAYKKRVIVALPAMPSMSREGMEMPRDHQQSLIPDNKALFHGNQIMYHVHTHWPSGCQHQEVLVCQ